MTKTSLDVTTAALRRLGVAAVDIPASSEDAELALEHYRGLFSELTDKEGFDLLTDIEAVPDWAFLPLAQMLAVELSPTYGVPKPETDWFQAMRRLRRHQFPDDRTDPADLDNDGTITAEETQNFLEARYY